jgi:hypothetical protein
VASVSPSPRSPFAGITTVTLWHQRLGHPGQAALRSALSSFSFDCSKSAPHTCHACQLGKNVRLPFQSSQIVSYFPFQLLNLDVWTSPLVSISGYQYYLVVIDDFSHYVWTFPMRNKSEVFSITTDFFAYVQIQFQRPVPPCTSD